VKIIADITLTELAAVISDALEQQNIIEVLSGGVAKSIYSNEIWQA